MPRAAWDAGLFGEGDKPFRGLPKRIPDSQKFLLDILPVKFKSVQRYGFQWDYIRYNHDKLRMLISRGDKKEYIIRRDPRDLSKLFMLYTGNGKTEYWEIPYANLSREKITLEDHKAAMAYLNERNAAEINEDMIFKAHRKIQEIATKAKVETKKARRQRAKKKYAEISSVRAPTSAPVIEREKIPPRPISAIKRKPLSDDFDDIDLME